MRKVVIVCGPPGSGKTTLAAELSIRKRWFCLHKDTIKEALYDQIKATADLPLTFVDSQRIGMHSINILKAIIKEQIKRDMDLIVEAPFDHKRDVSFFQELVREHSARITVVTCTVDEKTRLKRVEDRPRHRAHHDNDRLTVTGGTRKANFDYTVLPGHKIEVTTDKSPGELAHEVMMELV